MIHELSRLPGEQAERLRASVEPLVERAIAFLAAVMDVGRLRRGDPCLAALAETLRRVG